MDYYDENGELIASDTFDHTCPDCLEVVHVVDGQSKPHNCAMPEHLRGRIGQAWADGERWVLDHPEQYGLVREPTR